MSERLGERFSKGEWEALLADAEAQASRDWDINFVAGLRDKYEEFGSEMFLSGKQLEQLERIASGESW